MKTTLNKYDFVDKFMPIRPDNFSRKGLEALFDYYEGLEADTGTETEFDPIGICCEWSEYDSALECVEQDYNGKDNSTCPECGELAGTLDDDGYCPHCRVKFRTVGAMEHWNEEAEEWLSDKTTTIVFDGGILIQQF